MGILWTCVILSHLFPQPKATRTATTSPAASQRRPPSCPEDPSLSPFNNAAHKPQNTAWLTGRVREVTQPRCLGRGHREKGVARRVR